LLRCPDQRGLLARITQLAARAGPLLNCEVHIEVPSGADCGSSTAEFHSRTEFAYDPEAWPRDKMEADFTTLAAELGATRSKLHVPRLDPRPRLGVLVSQIDHCLTELLHRWEGGELPVELTCVIRRGARSSTARGTARRGTETPWQRSNHQRERNSYVSRFLERHGVPLYFVPAGRSVAAGQMRSHEPAILSLVHRTDFLVLARYMQVLSGRFLNEYSRDVINIHVR
jgi:formyltetrahydrofolate deformylase